jgi:hypothetical protein
VDAGDLLAPQNDLQGELKGEVLARAYELMRYNAITLGETDLLFGMSYLGNLLSQFDLPIVSMNVRERYADERLSQVGAEDSGSSVSEAAGEGLDRGAVDAGNAGGSGRTGTAPGATGDTVRPQGSMQDAAPSRTDHTSRAGRAARDSKGEVLDFPDYVLENVGGVKVAMVGLLNHRVALPATVVDSVRIGHMEKYLVGFLPQISKEADVVIALAHCGSVERARLVAVAFEDLDVVIAGHVEPANPGPEEINETIVAYVRGQGRYIGRLDLQLDENKSIVGFQHEAVPVAPSLPDDPDVLGLLSEYIDRLRVLVSSTAFRPTEKDLREPETHYVTSDACTDCHPEQYKQWKETPHAHAFESITESNRDFDPDCQKCHTTGFRYLSGFVTPRGTPQFKHVGCEACHGPARDHRDNPTAGYGKITEDTCLDCHTKHNSPEFEYEKYLRKIRH